MLLSIAACQRTRYYHDVKVDENLGFEFFENNLPVNLELINRSYECNALVIL
jgi:hypothetical protein